MSAEKRSVSAPEELFAQADARQRQLGYSKFSDYIQALIRADVIREGGHVREVAPEYKINSSPGLQVAGEVLEKAADLDQSATTPAPIPKPSTTYKAPRKKARGNGRHE